MFQAEMSDRLIADELQAALRQRHDRPADHCARANQLDKRCDFAGRDCKSQTRVWFCLPNIKLPGAVSVAIGGNRRRAKAFGFPFFCDQEFKSTSLGAADDLGDRSYFGCNSNRVFSRTRDQVAQRRSASTGAK